MESHLLMVGAITPRAPHVNTRLKLLSIETLTRSYFDHGLPFLDVIATDDQGERIGLTVKNTHKKKYEELLKEQQIYVFKSIGTLKLSNHNSLNHWTHDCKLIFTNKTTFVPVPPTQWSGSDGFKFIPFIDLITCQLSEKHTADVIGCVNYYDREPKYYGSSNDEKSKYINLELKDLDGSIVSCTLFRTYMVKFLAYMKQLDSSQCVILVIQFGRTKKFQHQLTVGTDWTHTRVFMDSDLPVIEDFRKRYLAVQNDNDSQSSFAPSFTPSLTPKGKPLDEWFQNVLCVGCDDLSINHSTINTNTLFGGYIVVVNGTVFAAITWEGTFVVEAEIIAIEPHEPWSYIACKKCHKTAPTTSKDVDLTLDIDQQLLLKRICRDCGEHPQVALRFKVSVRVVDATGIATFTVFESLVKKYVTESAYEIKKALPEDEDQPVELEALVGNTLLCKLEITGNHKKYKQTNFTVKEYSTDEVFVDHFRQQFKIDRPKFKQMKLEAATADMSVSPKCGSSNLSANEKHMVDLASSTGYTPPKKQIKEEPNESPLSVKSSTTRHKKFNLGDD
ncbi:uncharacterized protein [Rutidosis leptorrhynchoides]|uniref:uncharacterized protein n=1 Tax=Rutidosis leptorrhynchoides TaxID=125765 RepID=UPI003A998DFC